MLTSCYRMAFQIVGLFHLLAFGVFIQDIKTQSVTLQCPREAQLIGKDCYHFINVSVDFEDAVDVCNKSGATLLTLQTDREAENVSDVAAKRFPGQSYWIYNGRELDQINDTFCNGVWQANRASDSRESSFTAISSNNQGIWAETWVWVNLPVVCKSPACPAGSFHCSDGMCLNTSLRCDGSPQCPDSSDEFNCSDNETSWREEEKVSVTEEPQVLTFPPLSFGQQPTRFKKQWVLEAPEGQLVTVEVLNNTFGSDVYIVENVGFQLNDPTTGKVIYVSSRNSMRLILKSHAGNHVFNASARAGCDFHMVVSPVASFSLNKLLGNQMCQWNFTSESGQGQGMNRYSPRLQLYNGTAFISSTLFAGLYKTSNPLNVEYTNDQLSLVYHAGRSNQSVSLHGLISQGCLAIEDQNIIVTPNDTNISGEIYQVLLTCKDGFAFKQANYQRVGKLVASCLVCGQWNFTTPPECQVVHCGYPPAAPSSRITNITNNGTYQSEAFFKCLPGFNMSGSPWVTCLANGSWSAWNFTCNISKCSNISEPTNGNMTVNGDYSVGTIVNFSCDPGYDLHGPYKIACLSDGTWSSTPNPSCQALSCPLLTNIPHGRFNSTSLPKYNESVEVSCDVGYLRNNSATVKCGADRNLIFDGELCIDDDECSNPIYNHSGINCTNLDGSFQLSCRKGYNGSNCTDIDECSLSLCKHNCSNSPGSYECSCNEGYVLYTENGTMEFYIPQKEDGLKINDVYEINRTCVPVTCESPTDNQNYGLFLRKKSHYHYNESIEMVCYYGYRPVNSSVATCLSNGNWSHLTDLACREVECELENKNGSMNINVSSKTYGSSFEFACDDSSGFKLRGSSVLGNNTVICQGNGQWGYGSLECQGFDDFGSHNVCDSKPCKNEGRCKSQDGINFTCECKSEKYCFFQKKSNYTGDQNYVYVQEISNTTECDRLCYENSSCLAYAVEDDYYCHQYGQVKVGKLTDEEWNADPYQKICTNQQIFCGQLCEVDVYRDCSRKDTCDQNQLCQDSLYNVSKCLNPSGAYEYWCEVNPCVRHNCSGNSTCIPLALGHSKCECDPGFTGDWCETEIPNYNIQSYICREKYNGTLAHCSCVNESSGGDCEVQNLLCDNMNQTCVAIDESFCLHDTQNFQFNCSCGENFVTDPNNSMVCIPKNFCSSNPCHNATCHSVSGGFVCNCTPGYEGSLCQHNTDDCLKHECKNGSTCKDLVGNYSCECVPGFTGRFCNTSIDDCNGSCVEANIVGQCQDLVQDFFCNCKPGYSGKNCSEKLNKCETLEPCQHGGTCTNLTDGYNCLCHDGWTGTNCTHEINNCHNDTCTESATCFTLPTDYFCHCNNNYWGLNCTRPASSVCAYLNETICTNGGTCVPEGETANCTCTEGFTGVACELKELFANDTNCDTVKELIKLGATELLLTCDECLTEATYVQFHNQNKTCVCPSYKTVVASKCLLTTCYAGQMLNETTNECLNCSINYYQEEDGRNSCIQCPDKKVTKNAGSSSQKDCINDSVCNPGQMLNEKSNECVDCLQNYYQDQVGKNSCIPCQNQTVTLKSGSKSEKDCLKYGLCAKGMKLNKTSNECVSCPKDTYQDQVGSTSCYHCPSQKVTINKGSESVNDCISDTDASRHADASKDEDNLDLILGLSIGIGGFLLLLLLIAVCCFYWIYTRKYSRTSKTSSVTEVSEETLSPRNPSTVWTDPTMYNKPMGLYESDPSVYFKNSEVFDIKLPKVNHISLNYYGPNSDWSL